ncbi:hypothetical protein BD626DRAFT_501090 [Schizophyllum amplum]|uniref:Tyrosine specific protein phosphatases domain-containing protein n=1 Tax=Schizophyllum amplum TaxID=97359 RepID=A0A550C9I4_9AGAR|nr:hypothetical protein BD626DRAFT_501090 [Auriculariopsis ampla]
MTCHMNSVASMSSLVEDQRQIQELHPADRPAPLSAHCPRPIPNSYWATPLLLACEYPWTPKDPYRPKLDALLKAGVRTFIDLTEDGELRSYVQCGILNDRAELLGIDPSTLDVLHILRDNERRRRITAVHCRGGIGRTGMVIGCWLVESGLAKDGEDALQIIAREWATVEKCRRFPHSPETGPQCLFVKNFIAENKAMAARVNSTLAVR